MKVLFVCRSNTGRSQCAEDFYNYYSGTKDAQSAGTNVDLSMPLVRDVQAAATLLKVLAAEYPIDTSENIRTQITPEMALEFDKVISMAELEDTPQWLSEMPTYEFWEVPDMPDKDWDTTKYSVDLIQQKVQELLASSS